MKFSVACTTAAFVVSALLAASASSALAIDGCGGYDTCQTCIKAPVGCAWCSDATRILPANTTGPHCVGTTTGVTFLCSWVLSLDTCVSGYVCQNSQCVLAPPGEGRSLAE